MRVVALVLLSIAASGTGVVLAQSEPAARERSEASPPQEAPEEVIVRGRRLNELKLEVETAQERAYVIFNEINSDDDFDVYCREEGRTGTRSTQRVCRAQFEHRISASAAKGYLSGLLSVCPGGGGVTQDCMFSAYAQSSISRLQGGAAETRSKRDELNEEILRLATEDDRFAQAIIDFYEASQQYEAARKRPKD